MDVTKYTTELYYLPCKANKELVLGSGGNICLFFLYNRNVKEYLRPLKVSDKKNSKSDRTKLNIKDSLRDSCKREMMGISSLCYQRLDVMLR